VTTAADTIVRMGEWAVSADPDANLVTIGLGSCIGLVLVDRIRQVAGLAHVMLPGARPGQADGMPASARGKYGDLAVDALLDAVLEAGARRIGLEAALVGGAHMFGFGAKQLDVGARNEAAVRAGLEAVRLPVKAAATGGSNGRTVRVHVGHGRVLVRAAKGADEVLMKGKQ
jgi:chemotaxis protein CheD